MKSEIEKAGETILSINQEKENGTKHSDIVPHLKLQADEASKTRKRVAEIREMRGDRHKLFRMSDGTKQVEFYSAMAHVYDAESQTYEDVPSVLKDDEDGKHYVCDNHQYIAKFNRDATSNELLTMEKGEHKVWMSSGLSHTEIHPGYRSDYRGNGMYNKLTYAHGNDGDLYEYCVFCDGVKENIIVHEKKDSYSYEFFLKCENVTPEITSNNVITFTSTVTGESVFEIPSPYMYDAKGVFSDAVTYEMKSIDTDMIMFTVIADSSFINTPDREFPVVIDPQINLSGSSGFSTYGGCEGALVTISNTQHIVGVQSGKDYRMYMSLTMPSLPRNPRIKKAELVLTQQNSSINSSVTPRLGLYRVPGTISVGATAPALDTNLIDYAVVKAGLEGSVSYNFDITTLFDQMLKGEVATTNVAVKFINESSVESSSLYLYGSKNTSDYAPKIIVTYESSYAVNTGYRTHTHSLGRFGQGSVDLQCGNLMFESEDFSWAGNRFPVTIQHLYNSSLADVSYTNNSSIQLKTANFNSMKVGKGFKLNVMQSMIAATFQHDGESYVGFVYINEYGEETYFKEGTQCACCPDGQCYYLHEEVENGDITYDSQKRILLQGDDEYYFDESGRLFKIIDAKKNVMLITYSNGRITTVTDGAHRVFTFTYDASTQYLTQIAAPDGTSVQYGYSNGFLSKVTYPENRRVEINYNGNYPSSVSIFDSSVLTYKVNYTFMNGRVNCVEEFGSRDVSGAQTTYNYSIASGRTLVTTTELMDSDEGETENKDITTVYTFGDDGNVISEYMYSSGESKVGVAGGGSSIHPYAGEHGASVVSNIDNLLIDHNFEMSEWSDFWTPLESNAVALSIRNFGSESSSKFGKKYLHMWSPDVTTFESGVYQQTELLPTGYYTFSAYLNPHSFDDANSSGVFLRVLDVSGNMLATSEMVKNTGDYVRLIVPFYLESQKKVNVQILLNGQGFVTVDAVQLENNEYANDYNALENGNFERDAAGWTVSSENVSVTNETSFNMTKSLKISGSLDSGKYVSQDVVVHTYASTRETFTLSGWAKGYGLPAHNHSGIVPQFRLRAVLKYSDSDDSEEFVADFSPRTEEWQFASVQFCKSYCRPVNKISVFCEYNNNFGNAYFDNIQLVRNSEELNLSSSDFGITDEEYVDTVDETDESVPNNNSDIVDFEEQVDDYGNTLTETTFTDGEFGTIYRAFAYNSASTIAGVDNTGNDLVSETDARGRTSRYVVDGKTSRNTAIVDRLGNKTVYEYDDAGRTTKVLNENSVGGDLANVSYTYDAFDNMTGIIRGDEMQYSLTYNAFHNLESIGIVGKAEKLIRYTYKNGNGRLKQITYANGHTMKATYNNFGQMISEKWFETAAAANSANATPIAHYKYTYDGQGNIVRSIDICLEKEYNYQYEAGRIVRATECDILLSNDLVTSKTLATSIVYSYDTEGTLTKKQTKFADGSGRVEYYKKNDNNTIVQYDTGDGFITSHSKTDSFGRKVFDELQLGKACVSRQFVYYSGVITNQHKNNSKVKSSATTQLVSQIILSDGRTLSYEYDAEERITKVIDSVEGTTEYSYDALGQLLTEKVIQGNTTTVVNTMEYDNYGNITKKNGIVYTYDTTWKDLLKQVGTGDNNTITYDAQGNPLTYLGNTLTWEKGRQLKKFVKSNGTTITYTYNANGIRTGKTVGGVEHKYVLDGTKVLRETWGENTLVPLYDNEETVCGIRYNGTAYYFVKNLQGDVIAIVDKEAKTVARYSYDAWGVCTVKSDTSGCSIATINPYRYRCYYYDEEMGLYYLQSRYYDASVGRFINGDALLYCDIDKCSLSTNLFVYSTNTPVNEADYAGNIPWKKICDVLVGALMGGASQYISDVCQNLSECILKNNKVNSSVWNFRSGGGSYAISIISGALDAVLNIGIWMTIGLTIVITVVKHLVDWLTGRGFSIIKLIEEIVWKIFLALVMKAFAKKFSPKQGKKMNQAIRQKYKVKGAVAYRQYFERIMSSFDKKIKNITTLVDTIKSSCQIFLDFLKQAIYDCIIKGLNEKYA